MKALLRANFGTDDIQFLSKDEVDKVTKGDGLVSRLKYRKGASGLSARNRTISKGQIF